MSGSIIHNHQPKYVRVAVNQPFQMSSNFLMAFPFMDSIQSTTLRIEPTTKQSIPRISVTGTLDLGLMTLGNVAEPDLGAPVEIGTIKEHQFGSFRWCFKARVGEIRTVQGTLAGFVFKVSRRSLLTVYNGSGEVILSRPRFQRIPWRFR